MPLPQVAVLEAVLRLLCGGHCLYRHVSVHRLPQFCGCGAAQGGQAMQLSAQPVPHGVLRVLCRTTAMHARLQMHWLQQLSLKY